MPKLFLLLSPSPHLNLVPGACPFRRRPLPPPPPPPPFSPTHVLNPHLYAEWVRSHPRSVVGWVSAGRPTWGGLLNAPEEKGVRSPSSSCGEDSPLVRAMLPRSTALWRGEGDKFRDRNSVQRWFPTKRVALMSNRQKGSPKCDRPFFGKWGYFLLT